MERAMLWESLKNKKVKCYLCARKCVIDNGKRGFCGVRENREGKLFTLVFGKLTVVDVDPIEKKPLFHYYPGSKALSIATVGCNFRCSFCCNAALSQSTKIVGENYTPEQIVQLANEKGCRVIAYTYNEPTMQFEFAYRTGKLAHRYNIKNVFVTNGYMTEDAVKKISRVLDAAVIDVKASLDPEFYLKYMGVQKIDPIYECILQMKKQRIFIEITDLIVPTIGDSLEMTSRLTDWIVNELDADVPFHVLRFSPAYKLIHLPPTPVSTLEKHIDVARRNGLRYVYIGNVWGHENENTYCFNCGKLLIKRRGYFIEEINLVNSRCPACGFRINVVMD